MMIPDLTGLDTHDTTTTTTTTTPTLGQQQQQTGMTDVQVAAPAEGVAVDQPRLAVAQAPSFCRLCNVELRGAQTWRAHVKSDGHVYKLQLKVAEPGSVVASPPSPSPDTKQEKPARAQRRVEIDEEEEEDDEEKDVDVEDDEDEDEEAPIPDFIPGECLFCMHPSPDLDANLAHMSTAHGFAVPFQDFLAVDLETVVGYLHFVICGYRECISCGARKASVEGARQHMLARGHCRFDVSPDTEEFYEMPSLPDTVEQMQRRQRGDESGAVPVRLPSGKLVAQRRNPDVQEPRAPRRQTTPDRERDSLPQPSRTSAATAASSSSTAAAPSESREVAQRGGASGGNGQLVRSNEAILAAQLSRLRIAGDRAQHKIEARKRRWVDRRNNLTKSKHFRIDAGDSRFGKGQASPAEVSPPPGRGLLHLASSPSIHPVPPACPCIVSAVQQQQQQQSQQPHTHTHTHGPCVHPTDGSLKHSSIVRSGPPSRLSRQRDAHVPSRGFCKVARGIPIRNDPKLALADLTGDSSHATVGHEIDGLRRSPAARAWTDMPAAIFTC
ncbi:hypothetical protein PCL_12744 [Purpureocillium lilacinum]|uniref:ZN622/Rei1/Reh1 zinc finger C2H2-type domain-containing protein n=1 Tax=Purpureocillium lilacinum TaxID=33203 RepID=A0A2U3E743_PURLI|nr:hypothetical protein PCL_12744 [Purpureocillium lilacinum]